MRPAALVIPFALAAALTATPAFAFPHINVINVETLSTDPLRVRTTFTFELVGYEPFGYGGIDVMSSGAGPAVRFYDALGNADWLARVAPDPFNGVSFEPLNENCFTGVHTLAITTDQSAPCVVIDFWNPLLSKVPSPKVNNDYMIWACLALDMPTPAPPATWGAVKAVYR